jgi:hypothetical protein
MTVNAITTAAATPAPIATLPLVVLKNPFFSSLIANSPEIGPSRETRWPLVVFSRRGRRNATDAASITP